MALLANHGSRWQRRENWLHRHPLGDQRQGWEISMQVGGMLPPHFVGRCFVGGINFFHWDLCSSKNFFLAKIEGWREGGELEETELLVRMERWGEGNETTTVYLVNHWQEKANSNSFVFKNIFPFIGWNTKKKKEKAKPEANRIRLGLRFKNSDFFFQNSPCNSWKEWQKETKYARTDNKVTFSKQIWILHQQY